MAFSLETFRFLDALALNNHREWFEAHKARYEQDVREPALAFIRAMAGPLARVTPHFVVEDKKVGGSLMRVHRDTRFGHDKTPYKTNVGIQFRHAAGKDVHAPGFYVHVAADGCFLGLGLWRPEPPALAAIRRKIDAEQARWKRLVDPKALAKKGLAMGDGDPLKRVPKGYPVDHPLADELKKTSFILHRDLTADEVMSAGFVGLVGKHFAAGSEHMRFLCEAVGVPF
ncbi:MAG: DUF2461 domain-containing protein [Deltaproteobacteria bacterium]|nr:DUF2461 domain-containing protein [Deltaproteobacteria bacterium]